MNLKTYHADSIADALGQIKRELGREAVILHTRTYKKGGWFGWRARTRVEITATNSVNVAPLRTRRNSARGPDAQRVVTGASQAHRAYAQNAKARSVNAARDDVDQTSAGAATNDRAPAGAPMVAEAEIGSTVQGPNDEAAKEVARAALAAENRSAADSESHTLVMRELASVKRLVAGVLRSNQNQGLGPAPADALVEQYTALIEREVAAEIADEVITSVRDDLTRAELGDQDRVMRAVRKRLAVFIPTARDCFSPEPTEDGRPRTIALVGPTGVGKTTTVAKLASIYKLRHGKRVGLVTSDTYRIAAVDQLRTYANIIGLPLRVALTPREMAGACAALSDCDVVLIDTAGRSQHDADRLRELREFIHAADPHETHLVLSGAASESVMLEAAERFTVASPDRLIFTKLDEMVQYGAIINASTRIGAQLSFVTTGQEVPDHIEVSSADRLADLVLSGEPLR